MDEPRITSFLHVDTNFLTKYQHLYAALIYLVLTLALLGNDLFRTDGTIISYLHNDTANLFVYWRDFGFTQLKHGNLALWNPHLFSGAPFLGGFESALLYPLNWVFLILPLPNAINLCIAIHCFLLAFNTYLWTSYRNLHPVACIMSGILIMFSGSNMMHIYAGHLIDLCTMAWTPLLFLIIDRLFHKPSPNLCFFGILTISMQILGGHPQYMFYTAIAAMMYCCLRLSRQPQRWPLLFIIPCLYVGACALSAIQFFTAFDAAREGVRSSGVSYQFASSFSFPPENFLTLISPFFLGDMKTFPYWGRYYLFGMTLFIGVTGLFLAVYSSIHSEKEKRGFSLAMFGLLVVLALGAHTPLFRFLYEYVPGFNLFRGTAKFIYPATFFGIMLAAVGMDDLIKRPRSSWKLFSSLAAAGVMIGGIAGLLYYFASPPPPVPFWGTVGQHILNTQETYLPAAAYRNLHFMSKAGVFAAQSLIRPMIVLFLLAVILFLTRYSKKMIYTIVLVSLAEMFSFGNAVLTEFSIRDTTFSPFTKVLKKNPGDYRILNLIRDNSAMATGSFDIWGYDPGVLRRYAEFISFTQGINPDKADNYVSFRGYHPLYKMLRLRYVLYIENKRWWIQEYQDHMPRLNLIRNYKVLGKRDDIFSAMGNPSFDPQQTAVLEKAPFFLSAKPGIPGTCRLKDSSTDDFSIAADIKENCLLLITDNYSRNWKVKGIGESRKNRYEVVPANYTFMAVPLAPGKHLFRLEYCPEAFRVGAIVTVLSLFLCLIYVFWMVKNRLHPRNM